MERKEYNRLINEKSPYLLQHADNPVDWYPWSDEAFEKAKNENKPILLSVGYSTCHWCHVMAHESFSDDETADFLNQHFISIKVDREERPDIDDTYMTACHILSSSGGWPLNVILTPDKLPFFAGTYFPPAPRYNMPSFLQILKEIINIWENEREQIISASKNVLSKIKFMQTNAAAPIPDKQIFESSLSHFERSFDPVYGSFGSQPKFPMPHYVSYLLALNSILNSSKAIDMAEKTLECMANGGIFDHVAGGFHRYSVDREWLVPHFEKMLYDQALISVSYIQAFQITKKPLYEQVAKKTLDYILRELKSSEGGFYSGTDADSEGEEGKFFVWKYQEIQDILKDDAELFSRFFGITPEGNFENSTNILNIQTNLSQFASISNMTEEDLEKFLNKSLNALYLKREERLHPHLDDKILTAWNGLVIKALALAGKVFFCQKYIDAAVECFSFVENNMEMPEHKLLRRFRSEESSVDGFIDDYSFIVYGLLELYEATFDYRYIEKAICYADIIISDFYDEKENSFFSISKLSEKPLINLKEAYDGAVPSGQSILVIVFLKLADIESNAKYAKFAEEILSYYSNKLRGNILGYAQMLQGLAYYYGDHKVFKIHQNSNDPDNNEKISLIKQKYFFDSVIIDDPSVIEGNRNKTQIDYCNKQGCINAIDSIEDIVNL